MLVNKSAAFVANSTNITIEITQLKNNKTTQVDAYTLLHLLEHNNTVQSRYCHKCNMNISYDPTNFHLYSNPQVVNTYLTQGFDHELKEYLLKNFKNIDNASNISSVTKTILRANDTINTHIPRIPSKNTLTDRSFERYLSSLTGDDLLFLYNKRIKMEAQMSREELPWEM
jgi:hypothetical protein